MEIAAVISETRTIQFEFSGQTSKVSYRPNCYTLEFVEAMQSEDELAVVAPALAKLIAAWELTENGQPIPTTAEGLARVPIFLLRAMQVAIREDMEVAEEEKRGSSQPTPMPPIASSPGSP